MKQRITSAKKTQQTKARGRGPNGSSPRVSISKTAAPLITLITDFGYSDYFVAAMKGVILTINPKANIIDITHEIPAQDIQSGAFTIFAAHSSFAAGTIHVAVVDPGVGSQRRPILIETAGQFFIGPDNGLFSYVCEKSTPRVFHLDKPGYFRQPVSQTFNGRDVFAPMAAWLSLGLKPEKLGTATETYEKLEPLSAETSAEGSIHGRIINVDHFGNCVTNITRRELSDEMTTKLKLLIGDHSIDTFRQFFAEEKNNRRPFAVWGSAGFLEIAIRNGSAAKQLSLKKGDTLIIRRN
ncbi:MAG TPA: SAM-dependent chlorinase/fluorinase [Pyrinomonadaceae bacterium]|nr:SAM-dependent chlorinase/fluorinase [Pyrinomonadaceae bacterium]